MHQAEILSFNNGWNKEHLDEITSGTFATEE